MNFWMSLLFHYFDFMASFKKTIAFVEDAGDLVMHLIHARPHSLNYTGSVIYSIFNSIFSVISLCLAEVFAPCLDTRCAVSAENYRTLFYHLRQKKVN